MINFLAEINKSHLVLRGISDTCGLIRPLTKAHVATERRIPARSVSTDFKKVL
jgi:hypothetical protein